MLIALSSAIPPTFSDNCSASWDDLQTSFDVCDLSLESGHYTVLNRYNLAYEYYFNIGAPVVSDLPDLSVNSSSLTHRYCPSGTNVSDCANDNKTVAITGNAWAYQIATNNGTPTNMFYLSGSNGGPPQWSLIDDLDPTKGVRLTYQNGDYSSDCGKNREFTINFECANNGSSFNVCFA